jgi:hypothetical protein
MPLPKGGGWGKARAVVTAVRIARPGRLEDPAIQLKKDAEQAAEALAAHEAEASENAFGASLADRRKGKELGAAVKAALKAVEDEAAGKIAAKAAREREYQEAFERDNKLAIEAEERKKTAALANANRLENEQIERETEARLRAEREVDRIAEEAAAEKLASKAIEKEEANRSYLVGQAAMLKQRQAEEIADKANAALRAAEAKAELGKVDESAWGNAPEKKLEFSLNAFHGACKKGNTELVDMLLQLPKCNVEIANSVGSRAVHFTACTANVELMQLLFDAGAKVDVNNFHGYFPLHWAAKNNHEQMVNRIVQMGGKVDCTDKVGSSPLHWAADEGLAEMCTLLINLNADPNATNKYGETALHLAAAQGESAAVTLLMKSDGDVTKKSDRTPGCTPIEVAEANGHTKTASLMKKTF